MPNPMYAPKSYVHGGYSSLREGPSMHRSVDVARGSSGVPKRRPLTSGGGPTMAPLGHLYGAEVQSQLRYAILCAQVIVTADVRANSEEISGKRGAAGSSVDPRLS